jgi:hypothetical protein
VEHLEHLGQYGQQGQALPGHSVAGTSARWTRRALRQGRRGPFGAHPAVAIAAAVGAVAIAAVVVVATTGSSVPSIAGTWAQSGTTTFTFTSSGSNSYTVSEDYKSDPRCDAADDGTVTGSNRHYKGSIDLYSTGASAAGTCKPKVGVAQITIALAANGSSASINLVGNNCPTCKPQVWTRQS